MGTNSYAFAAICAILAVHASSSAVELIGGGVYLPECGGSMEECLIAGGGEESHRRILATRQYISYGALRRNSVPCSRRGASYYNCRVGGQVNPYSRGCSAIARCRR